MNYAGRKKSATSWLRRGQVVLEYGILVAIVAAAFLAMALYVKRAVQGNINLMDDQVTAKRNALPS